MLLVLGAMLVLRKVLVLKHAVNMLFVGSGGSADFGNVVPVSSIGAFLDIKEILFAGWFLQLV